MSDANGRPAPIPPAPDMRGAVNLAASQLASRVKDIAEAATKKPLPSAPVIREDIIINHRGDPRTVDVDFVNEHVEAKRWQIRAKLEILGIDPNIGKWDYVEIGYGEDKEGRLVSHAVLTWSVPGAVEEKPALSLVKEP